MNMLRSTVAICIAVLCLIPNVFGAQVWRLGKRTEIAHDKSSPTTTIEWNTTSRTGILPPTASYKQNILDNRVDVTVDFPIKAFDAQKFPDINTATLWYLINAIKQEYPATPYKIHVNELAVSSPQNESYIVQFYKKNGHTRVSDFWYEGRLIFEPNAAQQLKRELFPEYTYYIYPHSYQTISKTIDSQGITIKNNSDQSTSIEPQAMLRFFNGAHGVRTEIAADFPISANNSNLDKTLWKEICYEIIQRYATAQYEEIRIVIKPETISRLSQEYIVSEQSDPTIAYEQAKLYSRIFFQKFDFTHQVDQNGLELVAKVKPSWIESWTDIAEDGIDIDILTSNGNQKRSATLSNDSGSGDDEWELTSAPVTPDLHSYTATPLSSRTPQSAASRDDDDGFKIINSDANSPALNEIEGSLDRSIDSKQLAQELEKLAVQHTYQQDPNGDQKVRFMPEDFLQGSN